MLVVLFECLVQRLQGFLDVLELALSLPAALSRFITLTFPSESFGVGLWRSITSLSGD